MTEVIFHLPGQDTAGDLEIIPPAALSKRIAGALREEIKEKYFELKANPSGMFWSRSLRQNVPYNTVKTAGRDPSIHLTIDDERRTVTDPGAEPEAKSQPAISGQRPGRGVKSVDQVFGLFRLGDSVQDKMLRHALEEFHNDTSRLPQDVLTVLGAIVLQIASETDQTLRVTRASALFALAEQYPELRSLKTLVGSPPGVSMVDRLPKWVMPFFSG